MKKTIVSLLLVLSLVMSMFIGISVATAESGQAEFVLITDANSVDDRGFNQFSWEGLKQYSEEHGKTYTYYTPIDQSTESYYSAIEGAVANGAKVIVTPGYLFGNAIYKAQTAFPDVSFIFIDGVPSDETGANVLIAPNTYCISFAEEQSGFAAGYAVVQEGYRKLGFFGAMAVPAVVRFGYGYVQGAEYAAKELGLQPGSIELLYTYTGSFANTPEFQSKAAAWYQTGTECIFGCGSPDNVFAACESVGGNCVSIGVDTDMADISTTCITSAMKKLSPVVYDALSQYDNGTFPGATSKICDIQMDAVGLPMETSRFKNFTNEQYEALVTAMKADTDGIVSSIRKDVDAEGNSVSIEDIMSGLTYVAVRVVE